MMAAGATYVPIATTTLGSAAASYTFSSIPSTYTDLILIINDGLSSVAQSLLIQFNGDTATNYSVTGLSGDGTSAFSWSVSSTANPNLSNYAKSNTSLETNVIAQFQNYSNTTTYKSYLSRANRSSAANSPGVDAIVGLWRSTSAINAIKVFGGSSSNLITGTTLTLYGIAAA